MQRFHGLLDWHPGVEPVDLQQVNVAGVEPAQGGVDLLEDSPAGQTAAARPVVHAREQLGREHEVLATAELPDRASGDLLGGAVAVDVGGVPERDAQLQRLLEDRRRFVVSEDPGHAAGVLVAEAHAAQGEPAHHEPGRSQPGVFYVVSCRSTPRAISPIKSHAGALVRPGSLGTPKR